MKKLSPEEKEKLQQKIREHHEDNIMRVAREADQRDGRQAEKSEPLSPKEGVNIPDSSIVSGKSQSVGSASLEEEILSTLKSYGLYVAPRIPLKKLSHARESCAVPEAERILGLIELTGSAKNALLFGCEGIYYHNGWPRKGHRTGAISYSEFPNCGFGVSNFFQVYLGVYNEFLNVKAFSPLPQQVVAILNAIRQSVIQQQGGAADAEEQEEPEELKEEGLPAARKLTDAEERVIQARISKGAKGVILIRFEKDDLFLQQSSSNSHRLYQPSLSFYPGEVMRGKVLLHVAKTLKARGMYLSVEGEEKVAWWSEAMDGDGLEYDQCLCGEHTIIVKTVPLLEGQQEIQPGNYEYPFECRIPEESTFSTSRHRKFSSSKSYRRKRGAAPTGIYDYSCACEYSVSAYIDVPLRRDVKGKRSFQVSKPPMDRDRRTEPISFSATNDSQDITLSVTLQDAAFPIGSQVEGSIAFQNYSRKIIRGIDVELSCQEYVRVRHKWSFFFGLPASKTWTRQTGAIRIPVPEETIEEFQTDFSLSIPRSTPETGSWHFFDVRAFVKVNLDVGAFKEKEWLQARIEEARRRKISLIGGEQYRVDYSEGEGEYERKNRRASTKDLDVSCSHEIDILPAISPQ